MDMKTHATYKPSMLMPHRQPPTSSRSSHAYLVRLPGVTAEASLDLGEHSQSFALLPDTPDTRLAVAQVCGGSRLHPRGLMAITTLQLHCYAALRVVLFWVFS